MVVTFRQFGDDYNVIVKCRRCGEIKQVAYNLNEP